MAKLARLWSTWSPRRTMRGKFFAIVLGTTATALLVAGIAMLTYDLTVYRNSWASDLATEAAILSLSTAPALAFDDRATAERNLRALQVRETVLVAALYDQQNALYAQYAREGAAQLPVRLTIDNVGTRSVGDRLQVTHRIVQNGEFLGTIVLHARYDVGGRIKAYIAIFALVTAGSMAVVLMLSAALQKIITTPLNAMSTVARQVVEQRDYSVRAQQRGSDEVGVVIDAFNNMLDEVQTRAGALEQSNRALQTEVQTRQAAEAEVRKSERLYRAIGESIDYGVWICDANGRNTYASDSFLRLTGLTQQQCSNVGWSDVLHQDDVQATLDAWMRCVRSGEPWYREHRIRGHDGNYHPILAQGVPILDDAGETLGWAGINLDIGRLKHTEEALRDADRRKDEFLATLAHELRNPLAPIRHATNILGSPNANEQQRRWGREVISRQVQHMALLLDDLLDVSRITRGRLELKKGVVSMQTLIAAALETARPLLDSKRHVLELLLPTDEVNLEVDALRISQSLSNLLTNAAKYTDAGGRITVRARLDDSALTIEVADTGIGLSADALDHVFEMFSQEESAVDRSQGGLGIGLALVRGLVALHEGTVAAASAGVGQGSTFSIRLPRSAVVPKPMSDDPGDANDAVPVARRCRVLVADDNRDSAQSLAMLLQILGYGVTVAHSGEEALQLAALQRPDVYVLDIGMPGMNGYETAQGVRGTPWGKDALLLALTGWGQLDDKARATAAGFDHHLTKPVSVDEIQVKVEEFWAAREMERRSFETV